MTRQHAMSFALVLALSGSAAIRAGQMHARDEEKAMPRIDAVVAAAQAAAPAPVTVPPPLAAPGVAVFSTDYYYYARILTDQGPIRVRLAPEFAPAHVTNFIFLAKLGRFNGIVLDAGGSTYNAAASGADYVLPSEFTTRLPHDRAGLLTAPDGAPAGQFGLTIGAAPSLDGLQTVIGEVVEGMDLVSALAQSAAQPAGLTAQGAGAVDVPPVVILGVTIEMGIVTGDECL